MKKGKAITLLSLISLLLVALILATFLRFSVGVKDYNSILGTVSLDYDLAGGTSYTYTLDRDENTICDVDEVVGIISKRIEKLGFSEYSIEKVREADNDIDNYDIKISLLGTTDLSTYMDAVFSYGTVEMYLGSSSSPTDRVFEDEVFITDSAYEGAQTYNEETYYLVTITFSEDAQDKIQETIDAGSLYISLKKGDDKILSGTQDWTDFYSDGTLTIPYTAETYAKTLPLILLNNGLAYAYTLDSTETIEPVLGENSSLYAVIIVASLIVVAIIAISIMFKGFGLVSGIAFIAFIFGEVGLLVAIPNIKVSMAGVVGIILATLLCIDGMILIIKRIQEEFGRDKTVKASVKTGYKRALIPILNTHVVSLIITLLLFALVTPLKSFAITASIGIVLSFIATVLFSRLLVNIFIPLLKNKDKFFSLKRVED